MYIGDSHYYLMNNINSSFQENGYYIFSKIFADHEIDPLIKELHKIRKKKYKPNFSSQATHRIIPFSLPSEVIYKFPSLQNS